MIPASRFPAQRAVELARMEAGRQASGQRAPALFRTRSGAEQSEQQPVASSFAAISQAERANRGANHPTWWPIHCEAVPFVRVESHRTAVAMLALLTRAAGWLAQDQAAGPLATIPAACCFVRMAQHPALLTVALQMAAPEGRFRPETGAEQSAQVRRVAVPARRRPVLAGL